MKKSIRKLFWVWNYDEEEKWLNEMAAKGLALVSVGFCKYTFEESISGEYDIRLELLKNAPTHAESKRYIRFVEETGAEYIGSIFRWIYFRKNKSLGEFVLYSDYSSRIGHLNRILTLLSVLLIINIFNGLNNIWLYFKLGTISANLFIGILCLSLGILLGYGFIRVYNKKQKLKKDSQLFEQ